MRVIAGKARHITLITPKGDSTRPTTDRIKETLFNMINASLYDARFLDLFSGSGAIGIEALSRGAKECIFIEKEKEAINCIKENLNKTKLEGATVITSDVIMGLSQIKGNPFDIVFMDPPYKLGIEDDILKALKNYSLIDEESMIIIEADIDRDFAFCSNAGFSIVKEKRYKTNKHVFISLKENE